MTGADDIDDGLDIAFEPSEDEGFVLEDDIKAAADGQGDDEQDGHTPAKRSAEIQKGGVAKKSKGKDKLKAKKKQRMEYDMEQKRKLAGESADIIAEKLATKVRAQNPDLSALELADLYLSKGLFNSTSEWTEPRNLTNLPEFLGKYFPKGSVPEKKFVLILSPSAIRVCDVHRATRQMKGRSIKLIKKNKLADDLKAIRQSKSTVLAATPGRLNKVLSAEKSTLKPDQIFAIVCDCYLDSKLQNLWDTADAIKTIRELTDANSDLKVYLY